MKTSSLPLKIATVAMSLLLVAAFIAHRAGVFDWMVETNPETAKRNVLGMWPQDVSNSEEPAVNVTVDPTFMYSSKSIIFREPAPAKKSITATQPK